MESDKQFLFNSELLQFYLKNNFFAKGRWVLFYIVVGQLMYFDQMSQYRTERCFNLVKKTEYFGTG